MNTRRVALTIALVLPLAACGSAGTGAADGSSPPPTQGTLAPVASLDDAQAQAIAELADSLGMAPDEISVVSAERVTWRDGSLGCPEPGTSYTQALVDGYRIVLRAQGRDYHYHGRDGGAPTPCPSPAEDATVS